MKFKKGDSIKMTIGKDKGKTGKIERVFSKENVVLIPGINTFKKHVKKGDLRNNPGIIEIIKPVALSKIAFVCPKCKQQTRLGYIVNDKKKMRICRKCKQEV